MGIIFSVVEAELSLPSCVSVARSPPSALRTSVGHGGFLGMKSHATPSRHRLYVCKIQGLRHIF